MVRNGTYPFTIGAPAGYLANPSSGNITVAGAAVSVTVTFTIGATVNQVVFLESGLATGTNWAVTLGNLTQWSSGANDSFTVVNGQYLYTVGSVAGYNVSGGSGWVNVSGTPVTLSVTFTAAGNLSLYPVAIVESGLVNGTTWSASLGAASLSSATSTLTFLEGNGTYSLSVHAVTGFNVSAPSGVTISGSPVTVSVAFTVASNSSSGARTFTVMLAESGLPNGTVWGASFGGSVQSSSATTIVYTEPNGTYVLTISPPTNYTANFSSPVLVNGTAVTAAIVFSAVTYPVTFLEAGLPTGALWSVSATNEATHAVTSGQSTGPLSSCGYRKGRTTSSLRDPTGIASPFPPRRSPWPGAVRPPRPPPSPRRPPRACPRRPCPGRRWPPSSRPPSSVRSAPVGVHQIPIRTAAHGGTTLGEGAERRPLPGGGIISPARAQVG